MPTCADDPGLVIKYPFSREGLNRFREITSERGLYINDLPTTPTGMQLLRRAL